MQTIFMTAMRLSRLTIFLIAVLLIFSFLLRIAPSFQNNIFFWFDQGLDIVLTKELVVDHNISLTGRYSGLAGVLMGPLWTWTLAIPFALSGGNPNASVIFFALACILSIFATWWFIRKHINPYSAAFVLVFLCFVPIYTFGAQVVSSPHPLIFLFIFFIWFCYQIFVSGKNIFWLPMGLLIGIFFQLEIGFAIFTIPTLALLMIGFKKFNIFKDKYLYLGALVVCLTFLPQALFDLRHNFLISNGFLNLLTGKSQSLYGSPMPIQERFISRLGSFQEDFVTFALFIEPIYLKVGFLILSCLGWFLIIKNNLKKELNLAKILLIILLGFFIGFTLYPGPLWTWYRLGLPVVYILLLIVPFGVLWQKTRGFGILAIFLICLAVSQSLAKPLIDENDNANLKNQIAAIDYVYENAKGKPFTYFAYTPPVYDYVWQHHFFWYGQKKYGYLPTNYQSGVPLLGTGIDKVPPKTDEGLFYLIIEPDKERPWQINGWKKTFIKVGETLKSKTFPGNIVVEERSTH